MRVLQQISFLLDDFVLGSPGQQLLDRFLIGFPQDGAIQRPNVRIRTWVAQAEALRWLKQHRGDFKLELSERPEHALRNADAIIVAGVKAGAPPSEPLVRLALESSPAGTPVFVYGLLAATEKAASGLLELARTRRSTVLSGTALPWAYRLPDVEIPANARIREGLVVVQGDSPAAELDGLEALLPLLERRKGGETGIRRLRSLEGEAVWEAGDQGLWSWELLQAALSRSQTPQGNPVLDGRTEDLVGLGLVPKLARRPRGWLLEHQDGVRSAFLVLNGVVADVNFAVRTRSEIISAQLFQAPPPRQEQFSRLAAGLNDYFVTGRTPWPVERSMRASALLAAMISPEARGPRLDMEK